MRILSTVVFMLFFCNVIAITFGQSDQVSTQDKSAAVDVELLKRLPKIWQEYLQALTSVKGDVTRNYKRIRNGKTEEENLSYSIAYNYPLTLAYNDLEGRVSVLGKNYDFALKRINVNNPWVIKELELRQPEESVELISDLDFPSIDGTVATDKLALKICSQLCVGLELHRNFIYLPDLFKHDAMTVQEFRKVDDPKETRYFLKFRFSQDPPHKFTWVSNETDSILIEGEFYLVTDYFLIAEGKMTLTCNPARLLDDSMTTSCEYDTDTYKVPLPKSQNYKSTMPDLVFESKSTFNLCETTPEDLQRFTLSHYGIPEPDSGT
ncbi:MAG: hypothetical protein LBQ66_07340, partial [Planctomycetaceae bacterium]|nr:hypothetical protein [Planctomycetaceae bacterium]